MANNKEGDNHLTPEERLAQQEAINKSLQEQLAAEREEKRKLLALYTILLLRYLIAGDNHSQDKETLNKENDILSREYLVMGSNLADQLQEKEALALLNATLSFNVLSLGDTVAEVSEESRKYKEEYFKIQVDLMDKSRENSQLLFMMRMIEEMGRSETPHQKIDEQKPKAGLDEKQSDENQGPKS